MYVLFLFSKKSVILLFSMILIAWESIAFLIFIRALNIISSISLVLSKKDVYTFSCFSERTERKRRKKLLQNFFILNYRRFINQILRHRGQFIISKQFEL